jgi:hypothetical protein
MRMGTPLVAISVIAPYNFQEFSDNDGFRIAFPNQNGLHAVVFRLKADVIAFIVKAFQCRGIVDQRNDDFPVFGGWLGPDQGKIPIQYVRLDHALSPDLQKETSIALHPFRGNGAVAFDIFNSRLGKSCTDRSDDGKRNQRFRSSGFTGKDNAPGTALPSAQKTFFFDGLNMVKRGHSATGADMGGNFPKGWWRSIYLDAPDDKVQNLLLTLSKILHVSPDLIPLDIYNI